MKVVMITSDYLPNIGGLAAHVYHLSRALRKLGHFVGVINPTYGDHPGVERSLDGGVLTYRVTRPNDLARFPPIWGVMPILKAFNGVVSELGGVDILHQHDYLHSTPACWLLSLRLPWVWTNHTSMFHRHFQHWTLRQALRLALCSVSGIAAVSRELEEMSRRLLFRPVPVSFIPNGVDTEMFNPSLSADRARFGLKDDDFVVLCPRRVVEKNGVLFLALAVREVLSELPRANVRFVFLASRSEEGGSSYLQMCREILGEAHAEGSVVFMGSVPMHQMPRFNALADVVVIPSLVEGVSLSALEAMATRRPLVATNIPGLTEVAKNMDTAIVVPPRDPQSLAKAIVSLYEDDSLRKELARRGYELVTDSYQWGHVATKTEQFYRRILSHSHASGSP